MKLINATPSPYGRKVAIALKEKGIAYEVQYDIPWVATTCVGDYSPLQQLPILLADNGDVVYDSNYILDWLELRYPTPPLLPADTDDRLKVMLLRLLGERLMEVTSLIFFELARPDPSQVWVDRQKRKMVTGAAEISRLVGDRRPALDDAITLGDIAVGTTLCMIEFMIEREMTRDLPEFHWRETHRNLAEYITALELRPSFKETEPVMFVANMKEVVE